MHDISEFELWGKGTVNISYMHLLSEEVALDLHRGKHISFILIKYLSI